MKDLYPILKNKYPANVIFSARPSIYNDVFKNGTKKKEGPNASKLRGQSSGGKNSYESRGVATSCVQV
ncbi:MAG: hypothetical protein Phog2KO_50250 [Phototrophicaceae bacterium]